MIGGMLRAVLRGFGDDEREQVKKEENERRERWLSGCRGDETEASRREPNVGGERTRGGGSARARRCSYNLMQRGYKGDYAHRWL